MTPEELDQIERMISQIKESNESKITWLAFGLIAMTSLVVGFIVGRLW